MLQLPVKITINLAQTETFSPQIRESYFLQTRREFAISENWFHRDVSGVVTGDNI